MNTNGPGVTLIGAGHSHVAVLAEWAQRGALGGGARLVTPDPFLRYSAMVPGWISGRYTRCDGALDLVRLAHAAGVQLVLDRCVAIDPVSRSLLTVSNGPIAFDLASIDVGAKGQAATLLGSDPRVLDVRPLSAFVDQLETRLSNASRIAVIGAGAGGVELAFAVRNRARGGDPNGGDPTGSTGGRSVGVTLITGAAGVLPNMAGPVRRKALAQLEHQSIEIIQANARIEGSALMAGDIQVPADLIIAALGAAAPDWPRAGGLAVDPDGFIAVDAFQRSTSHPHIFAAGDCARRIDMPVDHAGVHAVHTGPILAHNLRAVWQMGEGRAGRIGQTKGAGRAKLRSYRPRPSSLYLLSTGDGKAIASYGAFGGHGRWAARLKHWIDKRWISQYAALYEMPISKR